MMSFAIKAVLRIINWFLVKRRSMLFSSAHISAARRGKFIDLSQPPTRLASLSPAIAASPTGPVTTRNPVNQVAQAPTAVPPAPAVPSVEPSRVAQTTPAAPAPVSSTQAPAASAMSAL